uniref:Uncharacterized protein n=1 Tax=Anguilla anguilla TaxID=7936 RepID=A0A0E9SGL4_ANGAN
MTIRVEAITCYDLSVTFHVSTLIEINKLHASIKYV